jgi:GWxTD domain-containing protein
MLSFKKATFQYLNSLPFLGLIVILNACAVTNTSLNDNSKPKNAKLVANTPTVNFLRSKYIDNGNTIRVYCIFTANEAIDSETFRGKYTTNYNFITDIINKEKNIARPITLLDENIVIENNTISYFFDLPKPKSENVQITLQIDLLERNTNTKTQNDITVRLSPSKTSDIFGIFKHNSNQIILKNYVNASDSVTIKSLDGRDQTFTLVRYKHDFDPALSPIAVGQKPTPKPLFVDSLYKVTANTPFVLGQEGLYYIIKDTTDRTGFSVLATDDRFPKYTKPANLAKPMIYLTTNLEYQNINNNSDIRKSFEQFWLGLFSNNQGAARKTIKQYYTKVEEANNQFTTYKEGWKTDKGMVYVVLGKPDIVRYLKDKEIWVYTKNEKYSEVNFIFLKRSNQFIDDHYELNRFAEFQQFWYSAITNWRVGQF